MSTKPLRLTPWLVGLIAVATAAATFAATPSTLYVYDNAGNILSVTDTGVDPKNCGGAGMVCPPYSHATPTCASGVCGGACTPGWGDCNANLPLDGCETVLNTNSNCGACGRVCGLGYTCRSGACSPLCAGVTCAIGYQCDPDTGRCVRFIP